MKEQLGPNNDPSFLDSKMVTLRAFIEESPSDEPHGPDPEILSWLLLINALPNVYTLQSCAGHIAGEPKADKQGGQQGGWLWVRIEGDNPSEIDAAFVLPRNVKVYRRNPTDSWSHTEFPILEFKFKGRLADTLAADMGSIVRCLRSITE